MKAACITHTGVSDAIRVAAGRARSSSSRERPGLHGGGRLALRRLTATNPPLDGVDPRGEIRKHRRSQSGLGHGVRRRSRVGRLSLASLSLGRAALRWIPLGPRLGATIGCRGRWQRLDGVRPGSRRRRRRDVGTLLRSRGPCGKRGVCLHGDVLRHHEIPRVGRPLPRRRSGRRRRRHGDRSGRDRRAGQRGERLRNVADGCCLCGWADVAGRGDSRCSGCLLGRRNRFRCGLRRRGDRV